MIAKIVFTLNIVIILLANGYSGIDSAEFFKKVDKFLASCVHEQLVDYKAIKENQAELKEIVSIIERFNIKNLKSVNAEKAFWINTYNMLVINSVIEHYPINSPQDVTGFFDRNNNKVGGEKISLNDLENKKLREKHHDPRIHFALVCAAKGCPPLLDRAYLPHKLDRQLDLVARHNLNSPTFIQVINDEQTVYISEIFKWYREDFEKDGIEILKYINQYRDIKIPLNYSVKNYSYDWTLNEYKNSGKSDFLIKSGNLQAYTPSTLLLPGQIEVKQFNNLYTQTAFFDENSNRIKLDQRSTFFTGIMYLLYGFRKNINAGVDLYYKAVRNGKNSDSPFSVLRFSTGDNSRRALTYIAPKVKISPFNRIRNLSFQTQILFSLKSDAEKNPFLDYDDLQWWTQIFYDHELSEKYLIYFENGYYLRFDTEETVLTTPLKAIFNYYPSNKWTFYIPGEISPNWDGAAWSSYFLQLGAGGKYQLTSNMELEILYTRFLLGKTSGAGYTYNFGIRLLY